MSCIISIGAIPASAQTTRPATAADDEEIVRMSPFTVSAAEDNSYLPSETTSGTRYASLIMETPIAVNVVTKDFLEDFLLFDLAGQDILSYSSGFTFAEGTGAINLRGIRGFAVYKNGIREAGVFGPASLERTEIVRGANAGVYGQSEPSGLVNRVTKKGQPKPFQELRVSFAGHSTYRAQVDVNQPIVRGRVFSRFAASREYSKFGMQNFAEFERNNIYGSISWKITDRTSLTANLDYIYMKTHGQNASLMPFVFTELDVVDKTGASPVIRKSRQAVGIFGSGQWEKYRHVNTNGPWVFGEVEPVQLDVNFTHQWADWLSMQIKGAWMDRPQNVGQTRNNGGSNHNTYNLRTGTVEGLWSPQVNRNREHALTLQSDWLAQFKTGPVEHKALVTLDWKRQPADAQQRWMGAAGGGIAFDDIFTGARLEIPDFDYNADFYDWTTELAHTKNVTTTKGVNFSDRLGLLNKRLFVILGGRYDRIGVENTDWINTLYGGYGPNPANPDGPPIVINVPAGTKLKRPTSDALTYQTGTLWRATPGVSLFANFSSAFLPQSINANNVDEYGNVFDPQTGHGAEAGVKFDLFGQKLTLTFGGYSILRTNVPRVARDENNNNILSPYINHAYSILTDIRSQGFEVDGSWRPTREISSTFALSWNDISYTKVSNATEQYLLHVRPDNGPEWTGAVTFSYRFFEGSLKGFDFRVGVRYQGEALVNNSTSSVLGNSDVKGVPLTRTENGRRIEYADTYFFKNNAYFLVQLGAGYGWNTGRGKSRLSHKVSLDAQNLLNEVYLRGARIGDPIQLTLSYSLKH